jgi:hypothetical protein
MISSDLRDMTFRKIKVRRDENCAVCRGLFE